MRTFKALGALLSYPESELVDAIDEIALAIDEEGLLRGRERRGLDGLLAHLRGTDLLVLQEDYVALFDRTRSLSLNLYEHLYAESRERGQAMAELAMVYRLNGFEIDARELPDHLPLVCEFLSLIALKPARAVLADAVTVIEALRERLARRNSPYAAALAALATLADQAVDTELLAELAKAVAVNESSLEAIDAAWAEAPVTFGPDADPGGCSGAGAATASAIPDEGRERP
ncbi:MAG TPA: nitrate reductase molybdenum cofactor assembly chaperone [Alphaproteobacteria bacterium]|nr:nitrate reductase molybdenum cofactor assembly chaperone [Alphaproteobacteria bacterium]